MSLPIRSVASSLLINMRYSEKATGVEVEMETFPRWIQIYVKDHNIHIDANSQPAVLHVTILAVCLNSRCSLIQRRWMGWKEKQYGQLSFWLYAIRRVKYTRDSCGCTSSKAATKAVADHMEIGHRNWRWNASQWSRQANTEHKTDSGERQRISVRDQYGETWFPLQYNCLRPKMEIATIMLRTLPDSDMEAVNV